MKTTYKGEQLFFCHGKASTVGKIQLPKTKTPSFFTTIDVVLYGGGRDCLELGERNFIAIWDECITFPSTMTNYFLGS